MSRPIRLFVSSSPDLTPEREVLGQTIAALPVSAGWEIKHTPSGTEDIDEALTFLERCDLFLLVLGADFAAPMGLEWRLAQHLGSLALAYRKNVIYSRSAQWLRRQWNTEWVVFENIHDIRTRATKGLAQVLLDNELQFGLDMADVEGLLALAQVDEEEGPVEPERRRGAGRGAVLLDRRS